MTTNAGKEIRKGETSYTIGVIANWWSHSESQQNLQESPRQIDLPYDPDMLFLFICPKDSILDHRDTCLAVLIFALFTASRTWKQPKYPLTEEWMMKMWYMYTMKWYPDLKNNEHSKQVDGTGKQYTEWGHPDPRRQIYIFSPVYGS